jgi:hypothetical protein
MALEDSNKLLHRLSCNWDLYVHLSHDTDWSLDSYKKIMTMKTIEDIIKINNGLPNTLIENCMLFIMRENIKPIWEDEHNINGGCFSYKVSISDVIKTWKTLSYMLLGETITDNKDLYKNINGITISPKRNFCIIKIWLKSCEYQNSEEINDLEGLNNYGVLFKKHNPNT